jgi:hypothetical protein
MRIYIYGGIGIILSTVFIISLSILNSDPLNQVGLGMLFCSMVAGVVYLTAIITDLIVYGIRSIWKLLKK